MKVLDKIVIIIFNICLLIVSIWISAIPIAKSKSYYQFQFKINNIYEGADENQTPFFYTPEHYGYAHYFTDDELDIMIDHIIEYLFGDKDTFALEINGEQVFGEAAVKHMADVKVLMINWQILSVIALVLMIGLFAYLCLRLKQVKKDLLTYTLIFYGLVVLGFVIFFTITYFTTKNNYNTFTIMDYFDQAFRNLHYLFFPFQLDKVEGSFFNDTLTEILTIELFQTAIIIVIAVLFTLQLIWLLFTIIVRKYGDRIANKIKQYQYTGTTPTK